MPTTLELLDGSVTDSETLLKFLRDELMPPAVKLLNEDTLPLQVALFGTDEIPTNQRNLTDTRTRVGILLEYELGKALNQLLPKAVAEVLALTYVVANRFPDLAFRKRDGGTGLRFEVKSIEVVAEEKSANFDTLIKDIRRDTDFVVLLVWGWHAHSVHALRYPHVFEVFVFDAYDLALMRDCYWLNRPPRDVGDGRQGFDLTYAVTCSAGVYTEEEGNYGKLMRIFEKTHEEFLPEGVATRSTLPAYYAMCDTVIRRGLTTIGSEIALAFAGHTSRVVVANSALPVTVRATSPSGKKLLIVGDDTLPNLKRAIAIASQEGVDHVMVLNEKFSWGARTADAQMLRGRKPATALAWASAAGGAS